MKGVDPSIYTKGIYFECQACGRCCRSRGEYGYVYLSLPERRRLARHIRLSTRAFTIRYCDKTDGFFHLRDPGQDCFFLKGNRCRVYHARPQQCRTWPFWPENMNESVWSREILEDCPGIGTGTLLNAKHIENQLRKEAERDNKQSI